jgi:hypothetical protein
LLNNGEYDDLPEEEEEEATYRYFGRIIHYDSRPKEQYGFIEAQGIWKIYANGNREFMPHDTEDDRIHFHVSRLREVQAACPHPFVKFCDNDAVEFQLTADWDGDTPSYHAHDVTGLMEGQLPCHKGVVTYVPYHVALRRVVREEVQSGQTQFNRHINRSSRASRASGRGQNATNNTNNTNNTSGGGDGE